MRASGVRVVHENFVLGGHDLVDRGEVAAAVPGRRAVADLAPGQPEHGPEQRRGEEKAELVPIAEQAERDPDEQPDPEPGQRTGSRDLSGSGVR